MEKQSTYRLDDLDGSGHLKQTATASFNKTNTIHYKQMKHSDRLLYHVFLSTICVHLRAVSSLPTSQPTIFLSLRSSRLLLSFLFCWFNLLIFLFAGMLFSFQFHRLWWIASVSTPMVMVSIQGKLSCSEEKLMHAHLLSRLIKLLLWC